MKIIVDGGCGFVGKHVCKTLIDHGHEVLAVDNFSSSQRWDYPTIDSATGLPPRRTDVAMVLEQDIRSPEFVETVKKFQPDAICHLAAQASLLRSVNEPIYDAEVNILGTLRVIEAARAVGARVVMATTSAVYDSDNHPPYREDSPLRPDRPYGISKASAEMYLRESGLSYALLRYGNVFGPGQIPVGENQVVPRALRHIYFGEEFVLNGSGEQTRDFIFVKDVAEANVIALTQPDAARKSKNNYTGTFNIATGVPTSVTTILNLLCDITGIPVEWQHGPAKPHEPFHVWLSPEKANYQMGWRAWTRIEAGLQATVEDFKLANPPTKPADIVNTISEQRDLE